MAKVALAPTVGRTHGGDGRSAVLAMVTTANTTTPGSRCWAPPNLRPGQVVRLRVFRRSRGSRRDLSSSIWRIRSLRTSASA